MVKVLAMTLGDRYGVGPELVARLHERLQLPEGLAVVAMGDRRVFEAGRAAVGASADYPLVRAFSEAAAPWSFLDRPFEAELRPLGRVAPAAGREVLDTLDALIRAVQDGEIGGIVYAPLNKQAMREAGHAAGDELDYFRRQLPAAAPGEINILGEVWTSRVTSHVPLRQVGELITPENVMRGITLLAEALRRSGRQPKLAMAALNPHAGEGGAFGREELDVLAPTLAEARAAGIDIAGPFPADTVFPRAVSGACNGVVTMFHDQGQIALKMVGLGQGITLLGGFPVPIATPGHGTAYDIAGTGKARPDGLEAATRLVASMMGFGAGRQGPRPGGGRPTQFVEEEPT
jgi:4-hydroxythreonine-4-phosphate dehydrogenase